MRIAIASDHAGFELKEHVKAQLQSAGHDVVDVGPATDESTDSSESGPTSTTSCPAAVSCALTCSLSS